MLAQRRIQKMTLSRQLLRYFPVLLSIFSTIMALTGCGSVEHKVSFQDNYAPQAQTKIEVGKVTNETKETFDVNIEQMLTDALGEQLRKEAMLWDGGTGTKLVLNSKIIEYAKGDDLKDGSFLAGAPL